MRAILSILTFAFVAGCASNSYYQFFPRSSPEQRISYSLGVASTISEKENSTVAISPAGRMFEGRSAFNVAIYNKSGDEFLVSANSIKVSSLNGEVRVVPATQLAREARNRERSQQIGNAFAGFAESLGNSHASSSTSYTTTTSSIQGTSTASAYGADGSFAQGTGTFNAQSSSSSVTTTKDYAKEAELNAETRRRTAQRAAEIQEQLSIQLANAYRTIQRTTVYPDTYFSSRVVVESFKIPRQGMPITVFVTTGNETHEFRFRAQKVQ